MIDIAKKKMPFAVTVLIVYIGFCAESWFIMRGTLAYYGQTYGWRGWFANDVWAFFLGGIVPTLLYEFFTWFAFRMLAVKLMGRGDVQSIRYGLNFAVTAANLVLFGLKFMFIAMPLYASLLNAIFDPVVTVIFIALFMWYVFKQNYVDKSVFRIVISQVFGLYLTVYGILAFINIILSVV